MSNVLSIGLRRKHIGMSFIYKTKITASTSYQPVERDLERAQEVDASLPWGADSYRASVYVMPTHPTTDYR